MTGFTVSDERLKDVYRWLAKAINNYGPPPQELAEEVRRIQGILERAAEPEKAERKPVAP